MNILRLTKVPLVKAVSLVVVIAIVIVITSMKTHTVVVASALGAADFAVSSFHIIDDDVRVDRYFESSANGGWSIDKSSADVSLDDSISGRRKQSSSFASEAVNFILLIVVASALSATTTKR